jgi:hypothetical protein
MGTNRVATVDPGIDQARATLGLQERRDGLGAEEAAQRDVRIGTSASVRPNTIGRGQSQLVIGWG